MSNLSTLPKGDSAWLLRKAIERIMQQVSVLETNIGSSTTGNSANQQVIFNDNGTLRGDAAFVFDATTDMLTVTGFKTFGTTQLSNIGILYVGTIGTPKLKVDVAGTGITTITQADITGDLTVRTDKLVVTATGVGIGGIPANPFDVVSTSGTIAVFKRTGSNGAFIGIQDASGSLSYLGSNNGTFAIQTPGSAYSNKYTIDATGISTWFVAGTTAMTLDSTGLAVANGNVILSTSGKGIDFSATANSSGTMTSELLNDYEEGTWTIGFTFGGLSVGLTTSSNAGRYTKVGRQVTLSGYIALLNKGTSVGAAVINGLPFTIGGPNASYSAASLRLAAISYTGAFQAFGAVGGTTIGLEQISALGAVLSLTDVNFANNSEIIFSLTYTV